VTRREIAVFLILTAALSALACIQIVRAGTITYSTSSRRMPAAPGCCWAKSTLENNLSKER
jgi:hypothetical protein